MGNALSRIAFFVINLLLIGQNIDILILVSGVLKKRKIVSKILVFFSIINVKIIAKSGTV